MPNEPKTKEQDEIKKFVNLRFITASEAYWHISGNDVHGGNQAFKDLLFMKKTCNLYTSKRMM